MVNKWARALCLYYILGFRKSIDLVCIGELSGINQACTEERSFLMAGNYDEQQPCTITPEVHRFQ